MDEDGPGPILPESVRAGARGESASHTPWATSGVTMRPTHTRMTCCHVLWWLAVGAGPTGPCDGSRALLEKIHIAQHLFQNTGTRPKWLKAWRSTVQAHAVAAG